LFQEYSEKFPHVKYTLGYAGRPGGPDFYISTLYVLVASAKFALEYRETAACDGDPNSRSWFPSLHLCCCRRNNAAAHGPGGQGSYDDPSEADPCFAKVIEGFDAVDRMHKSDVNPGSFMRMKHYVAIRHVRILPKEADGAIVAAPPANNHPGGAEVEAR
jgi:hypothetical protein